MKYIVYQDTVERSNDMANNSFLAKPIRKGYLRLYNKNAWRTPYYKIVEQCKNKRAWIVERKTPIDPYWKNSINPITNATGR